LTGTREPELELELELDPVPEPEAEGDVSHEYINDNNAKNIKTPVITRTSDL
jgi:hypothetical protein